MDVGKEVVRPLVGGDLCQFEASHEGVDNGGVLGCIVIAAEEIFLASQSQQTYIVLDKVVVYLVPTLRGCISSMLQMRKRQE